MKTYPKGSQALVDAWKAGYKEEPAWKALRSNPALKYGPRLEADLKLAGGDTLTVMGIVNTTPDSFWAASRHQNEPAVKHGLELAAEGAGMVDIGGESTRPGSVYVDVKEELRRVIPVVQGLVEAGCPVPLSIDTEEKFEVMEAAHRAGATWLNDVSALVDDPRLGPFAAETDLGVVLMHRQGHPDTMQASPRYADVAAEVLEFFSPQSGAGACLGNQAGQLGPSTPVLVLAKP